MRCTIGLDQIMQELFKSGKFLHSTKNRPTPDPSVLIASSVQDESGWTVWQYTSMNLKGTATIKACASEMQTLIKTCKLLQTESKSNEN